MFNFTDSVIQEIGGGSDWGVPLGLTLSVGALGIYTIYHCMSLREKRKPTLHASEQRVLDGPIVQGQGDFLLFDTSSDLASGNIDWDMFKRAYSVIHAMAPEILAQTAGTDAEELYANRYKQLKMRIKKLDERLDLIFLPRTLVELIYLRKCNEEILARKKECPSYYGAFRELAPEKRSEILGDIFCWHQMPFTNTTADCSRVLDPMDALTDEDLLAAYHFNQEVIAELKMPVVITVESTGFTYIELQKRAEDELDSILTQLSTIQRTLNTDGGSGISGGPTAHLLGRPHSIDPISISSETVKMALFNALRLDCSEAAQRSIFLYRCSTYKEDATVSKRGQQPYSLSFATGLLAGAVWDSGASTLRYLEGPNFCYAIELPISQLPEAPFYVPPTNTLIQLRGRGEVFHPRTLAWEGAEPHSIVMGAVVGHYGQVRGHLISPFTKQQISSKFADYKARSILLA